MLIITVIHIQKQMQADFFVSDTNGFIDFWLWFMVTRGERHNSKKPMLNILCWPHPNAWCILWYLRSQFISAGWDPKNWTVCLNGRKSNYLSTVENPTATQWSKSNWHLFKILKFLGPSLLGMMSSTLQPHFLSGGLLWQMVIVISFPRAIIKLHQMTMYQY